MSRNEGLNASQGPHLSMVSQSSVNAASAASVCHGSMIGGGFDFEDAELGQNLTTNIRKKQNMLLSRIDNLAVLREYGIYIPEKRKR